MSAYATKPLPDPVQTLPGSSTDPDAGSFSVSGRRKPLPDTDQGTDPDQRPGIAGQRLTSRSSR